MSGQQLASGPAVIFATSGAGCVPDGTVSKVSGLGKRCRRSKGQTTAMARPTTRSSGHECILTLREPRLHVIEVAPRVAAVVAVVAHHKEVGLRDDHIELNGRWLSRRAVRPGGQVGGLIERLAVDRHTMGRIAADHAIPRQADHPLDQVLGACVGQHADKLQRFADRTALTRGGTGEASRPDP